MNDTRDKKLIAKLKAEFDASIKSSPDAAPQPATPPKKDCCIECASEGCDGTTRYCICHTLPRQKTPIATSPVREAEPLTIEKFKKWKDEPAVASAAQPTPHLCPSCRAADNNPYMDAFGQNMRACGRCNIQWVDEAAHAPTPSAPSEKRCSVCGFDMADTQVRCIKCDSYIPAPPAVERLLTYADHLPSCTSRKNSTSGCNCGFCSALAEVKKEKK